MMNILAFSALTWGVAAAPADAPDRLISQHGVELVANEQVFVLFAALNAAGYSEESERKGPPLRAPVFHDIRIRVRDKLRAARNSPAMTGVQKLFEDHPGEIDDYLAAALAPTGGEGLNETPKKLHAAMAPVMTRLRTDAKLQDLFDELADAQRTLIKNLKGKIEKDFDSVAETFGLDNLRGPADLVVVPNPLDAHDSVRAITIGKTRYLVVGPRASTAGGTIVKEALRPAIAEAVGKMYPSATSFAKSWDAIKISKRIAERYVDGANYLTEALTRAAVHRLEHGKDNKDADEDFIDTQAKQGLRWGRAALKILDAHDKSTSFSEALPKLTAKIRL